MMSPHVLSKDPCYEVVNQGSVCNSDLAVLLIQLGFWSVDLCQKYVFLLGVGINEWSLVVLLRVAIK